MNTIKLDTRLFEGILQQLEAIGGDVKEAVTASLGKVSGKITEDTLRALEPANLPAGGKYSRTPSRTRESVVQNPEVQWDGMTGWVPVGFDFAKPGAGGYLITGTPRMRPDAELNRMFRQKRYMYEMHREVSDVIMEFIDEKLTGGKK